jgi:hypothetical protein
VCVFVLQALGLVALSPAGGAGGVFVFAVLFGTGAGAATLVRATVVARLYGVGNYGSISGMLAMVATSARALAPLAASLGYGLAGGTTWCFGRLSWSRSPPSAPRASSKGPAIESGFTREALF